MSVPMELLSMVDRDIQPVCIRWKLIIHSNTIVCIISEENNKKYICINIDRKCQDYVYIKWEYWSTM